MDFLKLFTKPKTYFYIWAGVAIGIMAASYLGYEQVRVEMIFIPLLFIIGIWVYTDYQSGNHNRWKREQRGIPSRKQLSKLKRKESERNGVEENTNTK